MTTHELALELMKLPDVTVVIEGWSCFEYERIFAVMTGYDPEGTAILINRNKDWKDDQSSSAA